MTSAARAGSRLAVGSSARRSRGSCRNARAIATRCCSPPESRSVRTNNLSAIPTVSMTRLASRTSKGDTSDHSARAVDHWPSRPAFTLWTARSGPLRCNCCGIVAMRRPCSRRHESLSTTVWPQNSTEPRVAATVALSSPSSVDFPAPEGPTSPTRSPPATASDTSRSAVTPSSTTSTAVSCTSGGGFTSDGGRAVRTNQEIKPSLRPMASISP